MTQSLTSSLATFAASLRYEDIPAVAVDRCRAAIIDCLGCMLAGANEPAVRIVRELLVEQGSTGRATLVGGGLRTSLAGAALANATAGHALDFDDVSQAMIGHPSVPLLPALLAVAELMGSSGKDILAAYAVGFDAEVRLGRLINPQHFAHGWHPTATLGPIAAAVGGGRLLGLAEGPMRHAIGIAASAAAGLCRNFGSMTKPYHAGQAAERGLTAALLARKGFDSGADILDGAQGFLEVFGGTRAQAHDAQVRFGTDQPLEIMKEGVGLKQYACCGCTHTALDVVLDLVQRHGIDAAQVESVTCGISEQAQRALLHRHARNGAQGRFSMAYCVAVALLDGAAGPSQFSDERAARADVDEFQRRVHTFLRPGPPPRAGVFPSEVAIRLRDGRVFDGFSDKIRGTHPDLPLTQQQVDAKFRGCAVPAIGERAAGDALDLLHGFERLARIDGLMQTLAGA